MCESIFKINSWKIDNIAILENQINRIIEKIEISRRNVLIFIRGKLKNNHNITYCTNDDPAGYITFQYSRNHDTIVKEIGLGGSTNLGYNYCDRTLGEMVYRLLTKIINYERLKFNLTEQLLEVFDTYILKNYPNSDEIFSHDAIIISVNNREYIISQSHSWKGEKEILMPSRIKKIEIS